jgi:hypothetical protein
MLMQSRILMMTTVAVLGMAAAPAILAQIVLPPAGQSAPSYNDADLKSFAQAVVKVNRLQNLLRPRLELAQTLEEQQLVVLAASELMMQAVEETGISVDQYDEILSQAQTDPVVADRIREHIRTLY